MADANEFTISTKQTDAGWNREDVKQLVRYVPSSNTKQRYVLPPLTSSPEPVILTSNVRLRWRGHWMQVEFVIGYEVSIPPSHISSAFRLNSTVSRMATGAPAVARSISCCTPATRTCSDNLLRRLACTTRTRPSRASQFISLVRANSVHPRPNSDT